MTEEQPRKRAASDRAQNQYRHHNTAGTPGNAYHCMCAGCVGLRRDWPRLAATLDGEIETTRRAVLYRRGEY